MLSQYPDIFTKTDITMKKILLLVFLFISLIAGAQKSPIAQGQSITKESKSKAVQFMDRDGSILKKVFHNLGKVKGIECQVIIITDLKNNEKIGCLKLGTKSFFAGLSSNYNGILDSDELAAAIQSLEYIKDEVLPNKPSTYTEVLYISRDNVKLGAYTDVNEFSNGKLYNWKVFVKPDYYDDSFEDFNKKHIETFIEYLKKAQSIISENTK